MTFSKMKIAALTPIVALAVTACGSSDVVSRTYSELSEDSAALAERIATTGGLNEETGEFENRTLEGEMPTTGSADYVGNAGMWVKDGGVEQAKAHMAANPETPDAIAALNLTADFDTSTISGRIDNFAATDGMQVSGGIDISNGTIASNTMSAELAGEITVSGDGPAETIKVAGTTEGMFLGDTAEALVGEMEGTFSDGGEEGDSYFTGIWGAEVN